jgi:hypothetical protein
MEIKLSDSDFKSIAEQVIKGLDVVGPMRQLLQDRINNLVTTVVSERFTKLMLGIKLNEVLENELDTILKKELNESLKQYVASYLEDNEKLQQSIQKVIVQESRALRKQELERLAEQDYE